MFCQRGVVVFGLAKGTAVQGGDSGRVTSLGTARGGPDTLRTLSGVSVQDVRLTLPQDQQPSCKSRQEPPVPIPQAGSRERIRAACLEPAAALGSVSELPHTSGG